MTILQALTEAFAEATPYAQVKGGAKDRLALRDAIYKQLKQQYEREARKQHKALGGTGDFKLNAAWKEKELMQKARVMADAVTKTTRERLAKIEQLPKEQQAPATGGAASCTGGRRRPGQPATCGSMEGSASTCSRMKRRSLLSSRTRAASGRIPSPTKRSYNCSAWWWRYAGRGTFLPTSGR